TPMCTQDVGFSASATGADGQPIANPSCSWTLDGGSTIVSTSCSGTFSNLSPGSHTARVTVTDSVTGCADTKTTAPVTVFPSLSVSPALTGSCNRTSQSSAGPAGGSNPAGVSYAWTFSPNAGSSSAQSGTITVGSPGTYTGNVTVTDARPDGLTCTASNSASAPVFA